MGAAVRGKGCSGYLLMCSLWCENGVLEPGDVVYDVGVHSRDPGFSTPNTPAEHMKKKN